MRTMILIAFSMWALAGCLDDGATKPTNPTADEARVFPDDFEAPSRHEQLGDEISEEAPIGVTRCMTNLECQRVDENTEYHYCDVASGVCIRSPWPF